MFNIKETIEKIYRESLDVKSYERILIIGDSFDHEKNTLQDRKFIARCFKDVADKFGYFLKMFFYESGKIHGEEPPVTLWVECLGRDFCNNLFKDIPYEFIKDKRVALEDLLKYKDKIDKNIFPDIVIAISYYSTSHTLFRKFLNYLGCRYASMPMVEKEMFAGPLNVDYNDLEKRTLMLAEKLKGYRAVGIKNNSGTDIVVNFEGTKINCDTGNLKERGSFGNLPAGEVYLAPRLKGTNGRICIEYFMGKKLIKPVFMDFKEGLVTDLTGDNEAVSQLNKILKDERNRVIAELGFGTNRGAKNPENVLEAEKVDGTCHIAIGDNITFGGNNRATIHIDFVIFNPEFRWLS